MIGSEGTLGITAACLKLFPQPGIATAWISVPDPRAAISLLGRLRDASADRVSSCELVPQSALELALAHAARNPGTVAAPWFLLVELTSSGSDDLDILLKQVPAKPSTPDLRSTRPWPVPVNSARISMPARERPKPSAAPVAASSTTSAWPLSAVPELTNARRAGGAAGSEGFPAAYGHAGDGNLHFNVNQRPGTDAAAYSRERF
jgi:FAD/FMN-containing dehydrogenase